MHLLCMLAPLTALKPSMAIACHLDVAAVVTWLQGSPDAPRCGFSKKVVGILRSLDEDFGSFDVLSDESVRQGIKKFSDWPTFPQLFVRCTLKLCVSARSACSWVMSA